MFMRGLLWPNICTNINQIVYQGDNIVPILSAESGLSELMFEIALTTQLYSQELKADKPSHGRYLFHYPF